MPRNLAEAYIAGTAGDFFPGHFADPAARRGAVQRARHRIDPRVVEVITKQNAALSPSSARDTNIASLRGGAAAVVTGQQVGLFLGPLFTIYKAASAIRLARALAAECGHPVVPIFWLQTEDHDLPEIAICHAPSARGPLVLQLPASPTAREAIAHLHFDDALRDQYGMLADAIAHLPFAAGHLALLQRHYRPGSGWADAFAGMLAELFAAEGLIVLNPRDAALGELATPIHRHALHHARSIAAALNRRNSELEAAGFAPAIHVRPDAPLSFFHADHLAGPRHRLQSTAEGFAEVGGTATHSLEGLDSLLAAEPLRFSTSALLRPILQDRLLPTAAYVGGPGEIAYFAQLAPLYESFAIDMPLVVPRARFRVVEPHTRRLLDRLHLTPADVERSEDTILTAVEGADARLTSAALTRHLMDPFDAALEDARTQVESSGPGLDTALAKTRATVESAVAKLTSKFEKALLHRSQATVDAVRDLRSHLMPNGLPQERVFGISAFAARWGDRTVIERVVATVDPYDSTIRDLEWPATTDPDTAAG